MFKKKLNRQGGFTMVEVVVASALVGILSVAVMNQMQMVGFSKRDSSERTIINRITDRLAVELSKQDTCTTNFQNKPITQVFVANQTLLDGTGAVMVQVGKSYSESDVVSNSIVTAKTQTVQVSGIKTQPGTNADEMSLIISFKKKQGVLGNLTSIPDITLPISIIKDPGDLTKVKYCYNDITNSIASAIRLSCQGNNSYYDASVLPYGACKHYVDSTACGANQFLQRVEIPDSSLTGTKTLKFTCASLPSCPAGQVLTGFAADGTIACDYPLPNCAAGQLMVRSTTSGRYICLQTNVNCAATDAITSFNDDGTVTCKGYFPPSTCPAGQKATQYTPGGGLSCSGAYRAVHCSPGYFINGTDSAGNGQCSKYLTAPFACPNGTGATGVLANGNLNCQTLQRRWCNGTARTHMNIDCNSVGGTVVNSGPNQVCQIPSASASCPGGWSQCPTWAQTSMAQCTDTNSNCPSWVTTRTVWGQSWNTPVTPASVSCHYWRDIPGDGNAFGNCYDGGVSATVTEPRTYIGCY